MNNLAPTTMNHVRCHWSRAIFKSAVAYAHAKKTPVPKKYLPKFPTTKQFPASCTLATMEYGGKALKVRQIAQDMTSITFSSVGTLSNDDDDGSENVAKNMNLRSFKLNRVYLDPLNMSNAGDFSWS